MVLLKVTRWASDSEERYKQKSLKNLPERRAHCHTNRKFDVVQVRKHSENKIF